VQPQTPVASGLADEPVAAVDALVPSGAELAGVKAFVFTLDDGVDVPPAARLESDDRSGRRLSLWGRRRCACSPRECGGERHEDQGESLHRQARRSHVSRRDSMGRVAIFVSTESYSDRPREVSSDQALKASAPTDVEVGAR
jgi:hypothetical protein